jgi:hypothetical protein
MPEQEMSQYERALSVIVTRQFAYINILEAMLSPEDLAAAKQERDRLSADLEWIAEMMDDPMPATWGVDEGRWQ